jgi:hypothetical protein
MLILLEAAGMDVPEVDIGSVNRICGDCWQIRKFRIIIKIYDLAVREANIITYTRDRHYEV